MATDMVAPSITKDPRFRAGCRLIQSGRAQDGSVEIFATLVEEARNKYGDNSIETAPAYYEYGNALFRSKLQQLQQDEGDEEEGDKEGEEGERKKQASKKSDDNDEKDKDDKEDKDDDNAEKEGDDIDLALEMMENSWSILEEYVQSSSETSPKYIDWVTRIQQARSLLGIGDVLSHLQRHADASDAYSRALALREAELKNHHSDENDHSIQHLICQRRICEANILVAEELLACPPDEDVVTTETKECITKASERIDYARGYYDKARDELQETVYLMGKIAATAAAADELKEEKENVCFLATLVMGVGTRLAEHDDNELKQEEEEEPQKKKQKTG